MLSWCFILVSCCIVVFLVVAFFIIVVFVFFFFSCRRRHTICALVTGFHTCALPILRFCGRIAPIFHPGLVPGSSSGSLRVHRPWIPAQGRDDKMVRRNIVAITPDLKTETHASPPPARKAASAPCAARL